jgi:hypothetical protein
VSPQPGPCRPHGRYNHTLLCPCHPGIEQFHYYLVMDVNRISLLALRQCYIYKVRVVRASKCFVFYTDGMHADANVPLPFHTSGLMPIQMLSAPLVQPAPILMPDWIANAIIQHEGIGTLSRYRLPVTRLRGSYHLSRQHRMPGLPNRLGFELHGICLCEVPLHPVTTIVPLMSTQNERLRRWHLWR